MVNKKSILLNLFLIVLVLSIASCKNSESSGTEDLKAILYASDAAAYDLFGYSVSINGDYAIVGAPGESSNSGAAYIFKRNGTAWTEQSKITAGDDSHTGADFGKSVSISGDYAIIGAPKDNGAEDNSGAAYIFKRNGTAWGLQNQITAYDAEEDDEFGCSVSINGDYAVVGAHLEDEAEDNSGAAYIFKRNGTAWDTHDKIMASDAGESDNFGCSVAINGDYVVIGASRKDEAEDNSGAAYIFKRNGTEWNFQDKITATLAQADAEFGKSVSISGDYVIAGANNEDGAATNSGAAYIFKRNGTAWDFQDKITATAAQVGACFGRSVAINGDYAVAGACFENGEATDSGAAYIFKRNGTTWDLQDKITAGEDAQSGANFSYSVAISGDYAIAGAWLKNRAAANSGEAYIFKRNGTEW